MARNNNEDVLYELKDIRRKLYLLSQELEPEDWAANTAIVRVSEKLSELIELLEG